MPLIPACVSFPVFKNSQKSRRFINADKTRLCVNLFPHLRFSALALVAGFAAPQVVILSGREVLSLLPDCLIIREISAAGRATRFLHASHVARPYGGQFTDRFTEQAGLELGLTLNKQKNKTPGTKTTTEESPYIMPPCATACEPCHKHYRVLLVWLLWILHDLKVAVILYSKYMTFLFAAQA